MLKNQNGFSLIELMVVVAIIGILSAVAVPQFQKFQRKAKQTEARANLSAAYTAQKIFLAETGSYYSNLWAVGYEPEGALNYNIGISSTTPLGSSLPGYTVAPYRHNENTNSYFICGSTYASGVGKNCLLTTASLGGPANAISSLTALSSTAFTLGARAKASFLGGSVDDMWTMNQRKELINTANGAL